MGEKNTSKKTIGPKFKKLPNKPDLNKGFKESDRKLNIPSSKTKNISYLYNATTLYWGRLGNHMFQYAALVAIAKRNNLNVVMALERGKGSGGNLYGTFTVTKWPSINWSAHHSKYVTFGKFAYGF